MRRLFFHLIFLFLIILSISSFVYAQGVLDATRATLELKIDNSINIRGEPSDFQYINAILLWYPKTDRRQEVNLIETTPYAELKERGYYFRWNNPTNKTLTFSLNARVKTGNNIFPVERSIRFPISDLPTDIAKYTKPSEKADMNEEIKQLAKKLSEGKSDLYEVVFSIADWVTTNIDYDISTINLEASLPSSQVLRTKKGVCDEMTNLFISLLRAVGVPVRFVSGVAYTNILYFDKDWVPHGWAEVYFPGEGWVPFDVTYGEYGFLDAGHIGLSTSIDSVDRVVLATSQSDSGSIFLDTTNFDVIVHAKNNLDFSSLNISAEVMEKNVAPGSFNLIKVRVKNLAKYYLSTRIEVQDVKHLEILDSQKNILLKPKEEKQLFFLVKVDTLLDPKKTYEFPILIYSRLAPDIETNFVVNKNSKIFDRGYFEKFIKTPSEDEVSIDCSTTEVILGRETNITCEFINNENYQILGKACMEGECQPLSLESLQRKEVVFRRSFESAGNKIIETSFIRDSKEYKELININVLDRPIIKILELSAPKEIDYDEEAEIYLKIGKGSIAIPKNVDIILSHPKFKQEFTDQDVSVDRVYKINFAGRNLFQGENTILFTIFFEDDSGNVYSLNQEVKINLVNLNIFQKLVLFIDKIGRSISSLF